MGGIAESQEHLPIYMEFIDDAESASDMHPVKTQKNINWDDPNAASLHYVYD